MNSLLLATLCSWHGSDDLRVSWVCDGECAHTEILAASCAQLIIVSCVMMYTSLGKHGIVLNLRFSVDKLKEN